jgi:hypothetical protein
VCFRSRASAFVLPLTDDASVQLYGFLNVYFTWFDQWFPLFGTISVAIFGLYLLLAVAKGNTKFGTRFFLIKVHPMEPGKTLMNAFVFNIALVLLCVLVSPVVSTLLCLMVALPC